MKMQNPGQAKGTGMETEETTDASETAVSQRTNLLASLTKDFVDLPALIDEDDSDVDSIESGVVDSSFVETASKVLFGQASGQNDLRAVDPETIEAILEAAGIGKSNPFNGKQPFGDLGKLASAKSTLDEEADAELTWMKVKAATTTANIGGPMGSVATEADQMRLMDDGKALQDTEESESLLSLACSGGYFELAQVLLKINANVEDRGSKRDCTPLMEAASAGHEDIVNLLLEYEADVNAQSSAGNTPLMYACSGGHEEIVRLLLDRGARIEDHNENGHTPLMEAASSGHVGIARVLLERGAGINTHSTEFKESALTLACYKGHLEMVKFLLDAGADHEHKTDEMHTALMEASMDGHVEVARLLLDHGAQVNMPTDSFESPLTLAACGGHTKLALLLLERGANIEEVNDEGYTPLMEAAREGHEEMVALLLAQGADINAQTEETQETALTLACCGGFLEVAKFLIDVDADIELGCSTPLMEASQEGQVDLVKFLLSKGANVHATTATGDTALTYACENGHTEVASYLLDAGADLEHESEGGRTPLMKAARAGHFCSVRFLISRGADVNRATTNNDHTVLSLACAGGHLSVVELLLNHNADPSHKLKDNSTSLIEAAKGGYGTVMARILNYPRNILPVDGTTTPPTPEQGELPRVPIQALPTMVPPQEPDKHPEDLIEYHAGALMQDNGTDPMDLIHDGALYGSGQSKLDEIAFKSTAARPATGKFKTAEEQILEKQQIIAELQKVERELQQRMEYQQAESKKLAKKKEELSSAGGKGAATPGETNNNKESPESPSGAGGSFGADLSLDERDIKLGSSPPMPTEFEIPAYLSNIASDTVTSGAALDLAASTVSPHLPGFFLQNLALPAGASPPYEGCERPAVEGQEDFRRLEEALSNQMEEFTQEDIETQTKVHPQTQSVGTQCGGGAAHHPSPAPSSPSFTPHPPVEIDAQTESNHDTALTIACAGGYDDVVQMLLEKNADIEHRDKKGFTPLILAATAGHYKTVKILLGHKAEIEAQSERTKDTPLSLACSGGRYEVVELLLKHNANKEHRNVSDYTPLSLAASGGYVNIIKLLLKCGAEINSRTGSKLGISPLMLAAMNGHTPAVKLLLDNGSDINAQIETNRNTALTLACFQGRTEVVSLLVDRKANVEHRAKTGLTPLMEAASGGYAEVGSVLINKGADVNAPPVPSSRDTALTIAADKGHYKFVELLLYHRAAVDVKNKKGQSPLWLACNGGHLDVVQLLVKEGADIDSQDNRKMSCLMAAFRKGHVKVVRWMVKHVNQFPSDAECFRFIATISDKELHKKCNTSFEIIVVAKDRQAAEANKNANSLLEELESEKTREDNRKAAQAKRKEKKRKKRKEKQQKVVTPEPKVENEEEEEEVEDSPPSSTAESVEERVPLAPPSATTTTTIGVVRTTDSIVRTSGAKKSRLALSIAPAPTTTTINTIPATTTLIIEQAAPLTPAALANIRAPVSSEMVGNRNDKRQKIRDRKEQKKMKAEERRSAEENRGKGRSKKKLNHSLKDEYNSLSAIDAKLAMETGLSAASPKKGTRREEGWKEVVRKSKKVIIPSSSISRIIGRNGVNINAIRDVTGAHIDVERQGNNKGNERNINIKGSAEATRQAAQLITALIKEPEKDISELMNRVKRNLPSNAQTTTATTASQKQPITSSTIAPRFKSSIPPPHPQSQTSKPPPSQATISQFLTKSLVTKSLEAAPRGPGNASRSTGGANMRWGAPQQLKLPTTTHQPPPMAEGPRFGVYQAPPQPATQEVTPSKNVSRCLFKPDEKRNQEYPPSSLFGRTPPAEKPPTRSQDMLYATAPVGPISKPVSSDSSHAFTPEHQPSVGQGGITGASLGHSGAVPSSMGQGAATSTVQKGITTNVGQKEYQSDMAPPGGIAANALPAGIPSNRAPMTSNMGHSLAPSSLPPRVIAANQRAIGQGSLPSGMAQGSMSTSLPAPGSMPSHLGQGAPPLMPAPSLNDTLGYRGEVNELWSQPIRHPTADNHQLSEESKAPGYKRHSAPIQAPIGPTPIQAPIGPAPIGISRAHNHAFINHQMYGGGQSYPKNPYESLTPSPAYASQVPDMNSFVPGPPGDGHAPTPPPNGSPVSPGASPRSGTASPSQEKKVMMPIGTGRREQHQRKQPPVGFATHPGNPLASAGNIWSFQGDKGTPWYGMRDVDEGASALPAFSERPYPTGQMANPMMNSSYRADMMADPLHPGMTPQIPYDLPVEGSGGLWNPQQGHPEQAIEWMWRQQTL